MRREAPVHHDEVNDLWAIATWDGVSAASRDNATSLERRRVASEDPADSVDARHGRNRRHTSTQGRK